MSTPTTRVFEVDVSSEAGRAFRPLLGAKGVSGRAQTRVARRLRPALKKALTDMVEDVAALGFRRSGTAIRIMRSGIRVFGTSFQALRGHIIGPTYVRAHEDGSVIKPKNAEALAIPLPAALRPDGTPKLPRPRMWQNTLNTFIYKSKRNGRGYIAYRGSSGRLVLLYALVEEVELSKHKGFLTRAWERRQGDLLEAFGRIMLDEFDEVNILGLARIRTKGRRGR